jgi:hypothetical protein
MPPTHRGLWRNLETPKQNEFLRKLSANWRRPRPTGHGERLDASPRRLGPTPFADQILRTHRIVLIEHDYPKAGDPARTSRFSARIGAAPIVINYDGTNTTSLGTQSEVDSVVYASDGSYEAVAQPGAADYAGRRRVVYPQFYPVPSLHEAGVTAYGAGGE